MSTGLAAFGPFGGGAGLVAGANPFGGQTPYGFSIPQGNPGAIEDAARAVRSLGSAWRTEEAALRAAAGIALEADGGWKGSAASAYAQYSGHVQSVLSSNAGACEAAAGALAQLAQALSHAQSATRQALSECTRYHDEMVKQQGIAAEQAAAASAASAHAASAVHPAVKTSFAQQASQAAGSASAAEQAANAAETQFKAAQSKGQHADEAYQQTARAVIGRLESAAGEVRQAPELSGGPAVPITVTQGDVQLANAMLMGAGTIPAMAAALGDPTQLSELACSNRGISPGVALEFLQGFREREQMAQIAAEDKPADGSFLGVIPGGTQAAHFVEQFFSGAWDTTKGAVEFAIHPGEWVTAANTLLSTNPVYRQLVYHENPITAQQNATNTANAILKQTIDYHDWTSGNPGRALGSLVALPAEGKALKELGSLWKAVPEARPDITKFAGNFVEHALKVPHAGDVAQVAGPVTQFTPREIVNIVRAEPELIRNASVARVVAATIRFSKPDPALVGQMDQLPAAPNIVVVPNPPVRFVHVPNARLNYRITLPPGDR